MKYLVFIFALNLSSLSFASPANPDYYTNKYWDSDIDKYKESPTLENLFELGSDLRSFPRNISNHEVDFYYKKIQSIILAVPGHARFFSDEYLRLYREGMEDQEANKEKEDYVSPSWSEAESAYRYQFRTLEYLPSPESITVLGEMLNERWMPPRHLTNPVGLALMPLDSDAVATLEALNLRNVPEPIRYHAAITYQNILDCKNQWRNWWAEVKSGKKTFSFKGQAVEYRFKPDGTWDTIPIANPPDDGPKPIPAKQPLPSPLPTSTVSAPQQKPLWVWIGAGLGTAFIGIMAYLKRRKKAA